MNFEYLKNTLQNSKIFEKIDELIIFIKNQSHDRKNQNFLRMLPLILPIIAYFQLSAL